MTKYRPIYVVGDVMKPGDFPFRPGMMVVQAVSLAGGVLRTASAARDVITVQGELAAITLQRDALIAKQARLNSEVIDSAAIRFPPTLHDRRGCRTIRSTHRAETLIFNTRAEAYDTQTSALNDLKTYLEKEVAFAAGADGARGRAGRSGQQGTRWGVHAGRQGICDGNAPIRPGTIKSGRSGQQAAARGSNVAGPAGIQQGGYQHSRTQEPTPGQYCSGVARKRSRSSRSCKAGERSQSAFSGRQAHRRTHTGKGRPAPVLHTSCAQGLPVRYRP